MSLEYFKSIFFFVHNKLKKKKNLNNGGFEDNLITYSSQFPVSAKNGKAKLQPKLAVQPLSSLLNLIQVNKDILNTFGVQNLGKHHLVM